MNEILHHMALCHKTITDYTYIIASFQLDGEHKKNIVLFAHRIISIGHTLAPTNNKNRNRPLDNSV